LLFKKGKSSKKLTTIASSVLSEDVIKKEKEVKVEEETYDM
jgi:hypothetical protein